jgi:anti-sigma factor (TIGR02949 family)
MTETCNCKGLASSISEYLDGELPPELCAELEQHMSECENCTIVFNTMHKTIDLYRQPEPNSSLPDDIKTRLYHRLHLEDYLVKKPE